MNVYDFDNTIYHGESAFDFYMFTLKKKPSLIKIFPVVCFMMIKYKLCRVSQAELIAQAEKYALELINTFPNVNELINEFWDGNLCKIKSFYIKNKKDDDVILSASFDFLIEAAMNKLGNHPKIIASKIDISTGKIIELCFRDTKVHAFKKLFDENSEIDFYTDSMNDSFMIDFATRAYMVKGNNVKKIK